MGKLVLHVRFKFGGWTYMRGRDARVLPVALKEGMVVKLSKNQILCWKDKNKLIGNCWKL